MNSENPNITLYTRMTTRGRPPSLATEHLSGDVRGQNKSAKELEVNIGVRDKDGCLLELTGSSPAVSPLSSPQQKQQQPQQTGRAISDATKDCTAMDEDDAVSPSPSQEQQQPQQTVSDAIKDCATMDADDESADWWSASQHPQQVQDQLEAQKKAALNPRAYFKTGTDLPKRTGVSVGWDDGDTSGSNTLSDEAHLNKTYTEPVLRLRGGGTEGRQSASDTLADMNAEDQANTEAEAAKRLSAANPLSDGLGQVKTDYVEDEADDDGKASGDEDEESETEEDRAGIDDSKQKKNSHASHRATNRKRSTVPADDDEAEDLLADFRTDRSQATHECNGQFFLVEEHEAADFQDACNHAGINPQEIGDSSAAEGQDNDGSAAGEQQEIGDDSAAAGQDNDGSAAAGQDNDGSAAEGQDNDGGAFTDDPQEAKKTPYEEGVGLINGYAQEHGYAKEKLPKNKKLVPVRKVNEHYYEVVRELDSGVWEPMRMDQLLEQIAVDVPRLQ
eukprot:COSAG02_NODE_196_length_29603_cov_181.420790_1_plen_502_part_10